MDFDKFIERISGSRPPLEVDIDHELMDYMDAAYASYTRGGSKMDFEEWLGRNPVGLQYLKKMIVNLKKNKLRRCPDCDGNGQVHGRMGYYDCPRCDTSGIVKEAVQKFMKNKQLSESRFDDIGGREMAQRRIKSNLFGPRYKMISTASEERTCPMCNGDCELEGEECWKCHGTGTVYKGVTKESMKKLNESGGDFAAAEENGYTLTGWIESRGEDTPSGQSISFYIMAPDGEDPIWTSRTFDPCDKWSGEWDEDKVDALVEKAKKVLHRYATGKRKDKAKWYKYNPKTGEHDIPTNIYGDSVEPKFKFNKLAEQLCESMSDQPVFVHARTAYNKMSRIKNAILTSATTMRLQMEDNSEIDLSLSERTPNYQFVMNDGEFVSAREVARIYGLLEPAQVVSEGMRPIPGSRKAREAKKEAAAKQIRGIKDDITRLSSKGGSFRQRVSELQKKIKRIKEKHGLSESRVLEDTHYRRGYPYKLEAVKSGRVVSSKVIRSESDLNNNRNWMDQQNKQGCHLKKLSLRTEAKKQLPIFHPKKAKLRAQLHKLQDKDKLAFDHPRVEKLKKKIVAVKEAIKRLK